jgi:hypothetical protein
LSHAPSRDAGRYGESSRFCDEALPAIVELAAAEESLAADL